MFLRTGIILLASFCCTGCATVVPAVMGAGGTAGYFYHQEKSQGVFKVPMEEACTAAIRTTVALRLDISDIETGDQRRIIHATDPEADDRRITIDLEGMGDKGYVTATFRATTHRVIPDRAYSQMLMAEFVDRLNPEPLQETPSSQLSSVRR